MFFHSMCFLTAITITNPLQRPYWLYVSVEYSALGVGLSLHGMGWPARLPSGAMLLEATKERSVSLGVEKKTNQMLLNALLHL